MKRKRQAGAVRMVLLQLDISHEISHGSEVSTITIETGQMGIAFLSKDVLTIIMECSNFAGIRAGFRSGTFTLVFR